MSPTIQPGDVLLVEKLSPRLGTPTRLKELGYSRLGDRAKLLPALFASLAV